MPEEPRADRHVETTEKERQMIKRSDYVVQVSAGNTPNTRQDAESQSL